jgi:hypothetical protein
MSKMFVPSFINKNHTSLSLNFPNSNSQYKSPSIENSQPELTNVQFTGRLDNAKSKEESSIKRFLKKKEKVENTVYVEENVKKDVEEKKKKGFAFVKKKKEEERVDVSNTSKTNKCKEDNENIMIFDEIIKIDSKTNNDSVIFDVNDIINSNSNKETISRQVMEYDLIPTNKIQSEEKKSYSNIINMSYNNQYPDNILNFLNFQSNYNVCQSNMSFQSNSNFKNGNANYSWREEKKQEDVLKDKLDFVKDLLKSNK